jgi:HPt (histidine-containing phosphotransfer) domain-containing protein
MNDYLTKPIQPAELIRALERVPVSAMQHAAPASLEPQLDVGWADESLAPSQEGAGASLPGSSIERSMIDRLRRDLGDEIVVELLGDFFEAFPRRLSEMHRALVTGRPAELHRAAHTLRSNSASLGASKLVSLSRQVEELGKSGRLDEEVRALLDEIDKEYDAAKPALEAIRQELSHGG